MEKKNTYLKGIDKPYSYTHIIQETARCLLCEDTPCSKNCPAGTDPGKFIKLLRFRDLKEAIRVIRSNNPLVAVCSEACAAEHYCQKACKECGIGKEIEIAKLEEFLVNYQKEVNLKVNKKPTINKEKVAIIGSGPSGLAAASMLAKKGYEVTVYEMRDNFGGWLTYGIPEFRLKQKTIDDDVKAIKELGVKFIKNKAFGKDFTADTLKKEGYKAILLAIGYSYANILDQFKDNKYFEAAVDFLERVKPNKGKVEIENNVLVLGGGDSAMDCALTASKLGAKYVRIVCSEKFSEFRASKAQLDKIRKLNVSVIDGFRIHKVEGNKVYINSIVDDSQVIIVPDKVIYAFGQKSRFDANKYFPGIELDERGNIMNKKGKTNIPGVFAAGDILNDSEKTLTYAIKTGKEVAKSVDEYLTSLR